MSDRAHKLRRDETKDDAEAKRAGLFFSYLRRDDHQQEILPFLPGSIHPAFHLLEVIAGGLCESADAEMRKAGAGQNSAERSGTGSLARAPSLQ